MTATASATPPICLLGTSGSCHSLGGPCNRVRHTASAWSQFDRGTAEYRVGIDNAFGPSNEPTDSS
jgi:hypothetical protein